MGRRKGRYGGGGGERKGKRRDAKESCTKYTLGEA